MRMNMWKKRIICLCFFSVYYSVSFAQVGKVRDVEFEQEGQKVIIYYSLEGEISSKYKIRISLSDDYGKSFKYTPRTVSGDIGKNIKPGTSKKIEWQLLIDFPSGIEGEGFVFAVEAELIQKRSKLPFIIGGGAVAVGTIVYFAFKNGGDKGTISVSVPEDIMR